MASSLKLKNANGKTLAISNSDSNTEDIVINGGKITTIDGVNTFPVHIDNTSAISGGLSIGNLYSTPSGTIQVVVAV